MSAVKHRLRYGYGNAPVQKEKNFKWYYDVNVLTAIYDYVVSPLNTMRNSYGVFNIKQESGLKATIGRVIRQQNNSDLVKNIMAHLRGLGLPVPSASFIFKFLTYLPAASTKEMRGVNNTQEDAMRAFQTLDDIVEQFAEKCSLPEDERLNLKSCLSSCKMYLKTKYYDNLSFNSPILSHCVSCSVSDPNDNPKFKAECENKHQSIKCDKCEMVHDTMDVLMNLMEKYRDEGILSIYESAVIYKRIQDSQMAIYQYQIHLIKVFTQENLWQHLKDKRDPTIAFLVADWGMKFLPRRFRGKQSEWYAQNGMSNHGTCFERIVPSSYEEDGITPKEYKKEVDTYVSLPNDNSKQDALTTAAVIKANIIEFKKNHPEIKQLYLRSDNAGCYKSSKLIQALFSIDPAELEDLKIMGYVYSAPCDGKSLCDTYFAIVKHHVSKMVTSGQMNITNPRELANAIAAASGVANVVVMLGNFEFREDCDFKKIPKITELNTISFLENNIVVWKQGTLGEGQMISMPKIPFPATFNYEFIGSSVPRRNDKQTLAYKKSDEEETVAGNIDDFDDEFDELQPIIEGAIYKCPENQCDAEYVTLGNYFKHQITGKCFKKTKKRTESIGGYFQRLYINQFNINQSEKLSASEKRYKHFSWDDEEEYISLLPTFSKSSDYHGKLYEKGFAVTTTRKKNVIHDDVRSFVREKFDEGEVTKRHMSYPKIVSEIENAVDAYGNPRFFPNKWLDSNQVAYLISKFMKEKDSKGPISEEELSEAIYINMAEENYARKRDALQVAIEDLQTEKPLSEQSHPLMLPDGTNICNIAKNYHDNEKTKDSWIMQRQDFSEILPILEAMDVQFNGKSRRKAGKEILTYVKAKCTCIPLRRKRNE